MQSNLVAPRSNGGRDREIEMAPNKPMHAHTTIYSLRSFAYSLTLSNLLLKYQQTIISLERKRKKIEKK